MRRKTGKCIDCGVPVLCSSKRCKPCNFSGKHNSKPMSDEMKLDMSIKRQGAWNKKWWKGGISSLRVLIYKSSKNRIWKNSVFNRDRYVCQRCGVKSGNGKAVKLEAHHIKPYSIILEEFLGKYTSFSPLEDKEFLLKESFNHEDFWDISNGMTMCEDCHRNTKQGELTKVKYMMGVENE